MAIHKHKGVRERGNLHIPLTLFCPSRSILALYDPSSTYRTQKTMEVLLLDDIAGVGKKNDLLVVGDGYALNFLLPHRRAIVATPTVRKRYAEQIRRRAEEREQERALRAGAAAAIVGKVVHFTRKVTKTGKLYGGISQKAIAEVLKKEHNLEVLVDAIQIPSPIKTTGTFSVNIKMGEQTENVQVIVEAEKVE